MLKLREILCNESLTDFQLHIDIMISAKMTKDKWINGDEMTDFYTAGT